MFSLVANDGEWTFEWANKELITIFTKKKTDYKNQRKNAAPKMLYWTIFDAQTKTKEWKQKKNQTNEIGPEILLFFWAIYNM